MLLEEVERANQAQQEWMDASFRKRSRMTQINSIYFGHSTDLHPYHIQIK